MLTHIILCSSSGNQLRINFTEGPGHRKLTVSAAVIRDFLWKFSVYRNDKLLNKKSKKRTHYD